MKIYLVSANPFFGAIKFPWRDVWMLELDQNSIWTYYLQVFWQKGSMQNIQMEEYILRKTFIFSSSNQCLGICQQNKRRTVLK